MFLFRTNRRRDLRESYRAAEMIQTAETPREADILTGYAIGIIEEKMKNGTLTQATADAITEMVKAIGDEVRREIIVERREGESERKESNILQIQQFQEAAEK